MKEIILWFLLCYGITNIIVFSIIFENFREFFNPTNSQKSEKIKSFIYELINCPMCFSTWVGFIFSLFIYSPIHDTFDVPMYYAWFFDGLLSSGVVWIINTIVEYFEDNSEIKE